MKKKILCICSGGLDSVCATSRYLDSADEITLMTFNYGQKGFKEMEVVKKLAHKINANLKKIDISFMKDLWGDSNQLTSSNVKVANKYQNSVVVPLRNAVFLQIAMAYAYTNKFKKIILGSHSDDVIEVDGERLYPDCSPEFFKAFELAMDLGTKKYESRVEIETPSILNIRKQDLIVVGYKNLGDFIFETWSCYNSGEKQCGKCESCVNRKKAFARANITDKTIYGNKDKRV